MPDFGIKKAYRPRLQEWPGYKTLVDEKSDLGILPEQTESRSVDRGQSNLDAIWPVQVQQPREKERVLPLPSNHDKKREKRIGPTYLTKPRKAPERTRSQPGAEYGHPTKWDYHMPKRRHETLAGTEEDFEDEELYEEDPLDVLAQGSIFPMRRQKNLGGQGRLKQKRWYKRNRPRKRRKEKLKYRMRGKRLPRQKLKRKYRRMYPRRYKRIGIDPRTPAQKTKKWREEQKREKERNPERARREESREEQRRTAGLEMLAEVMELLGFDMTAQNWPLDWNTHVKKIQPPEQLDQNYGEGQSRDKGSPRKDPTKQKGQPLRAPDLDRHHQKGLKWEIRPPAPGGLSYPLVTTMNPSDGSGKVIPMEWYTDEANKTQAIPDGRQDRYLRNNNDVKVAMTVGELLRRCDRKIKERSKEYTPKLARTDTKNWIWHWKVGDHTVKVQAFKRGRAENFPNLNLRISCSCPYWRWWGPEHWGTRDDYQRGPLQGTATYPKIRDPAHWRPVCKHAYAVLEKSRQFFVRPKKSPLRKFSARFLADTVDAIEVEIVNDQSVARVAQQYLEREICRRVVARYLAREES